MIFQQDLASAHTSDMTRDWLDTNNVRYLDKWSPKGYDLSPIEHIWPLVKHELWLL